MKELHGFLLSHQHLVLSNTAERPNFPQIILFSLLGLGISLPPLPPPFHPLVRLYSINQKLLVVVQKCYPTPHREENSNPFASSLVYLYNFATATWLYSRTEVDP